MKTTTANVNLDLGPCPLCARSMVAGPSVNQHHLIPKSQRGTEQFHMHRICHHKLHATLSEKEMATYYHTWERLREHPEIAKFVAWVQKKPATYYDRNDSSRRK